MESERIDVLKTNIKIKGKIFHNDGRRRIDLKRPIRDIFEPMEEDFKMLYVMELCLSKEKALERAKELTEQEIIPILFYFLKQKRDLNRKDSSLEVDDVYN